MHNTRVSYVYSVQYGKVNKEWLFEYFFDVLWFNGALGPPLSSMALMVPEYGSCCVHHGCITTTIWLVAILTLKWPLLFIRLSVDRFAPQILETRSLFQRSSSSVTFGFWLVISFGTRVKALMTELYLKGIDVMESFYAYVLYLY